MELGGCLGELAFLKQGAGQVKACLTELRSEFERLPELADSSIPLFLSGKLNPGAVRAQRLVTIDLLLVELLDSRKLCLGPLSITLAAQQRRQSEVSLLVLRIERDRLAQLIPGARKAARLFQSQTELVMDTR